LAQLSVFRLGLWLLARLAQVKNPEHRVQADRAIDALVYELYGLTEEEIEIVEGRR